MFFFEIFTNIPKRDFCSETFYQQALWLKVNNLEYKIDSKEDLKIR